MQNIIWVILLVFLGGVGVAVQGPLATMITQRLGRWESAFLVHVGGAILAGLLVLLFPANRWSEWSTLPKYTLVAGIFGVFIIFAVGFSIPRIGVTSTVTILIIAQLVTGLILDHFGLLGVPQYSINAYRILGCIVLGIGAWLMTK